MYWIAVLVLYSTNINVVLIFKGFSCSSNYLEKVFFCSDLGTVLWGSDIRGSTVCNDTEVCVWLVWLSTRLHHTYIVRRDTYHQMTSVHLADRAPGHCGGREIRVRQALDRYKLSRRGKYGSYSHTTLAFSLRIRNKSNIKFIFTLWNPITFFVSSP